jgi:predicted ArsR family transcriptional regulator
VDRAAVAAIAALDDDVRRALYEHVRAAGAPITREQAATAVGISRKLAAFHLDKLAEVGVVEVRFERTTGRQGPGAGRPSKLYRLAADELDASVPERHYDLAGSLLAAAVAESTRTGRPVRDCLREAARAAGVRIGAEASDAVGGARRAAERRDAVMDVLAQHGYEPEVARRTEIALGNCPFHRLAEQERDLVCGMNLEFLGGLIEGLGSSAHLTARLDPAPGYCCVRIAAA